MVKKIIAKAVIIPALISLCITSIAWGLTAQEIAKKTFPSVVLLVMEDESGEPLSMGSGFFVRSNIVVTNLHVIKGAKSGYAKLIREKKKYDISGIVGIDEEADLILLSIDAVNGRPLSIGKSVKVQIGDKIYAVGNPLGFEGTFSTGIVSGVRQAKKGILFQITAPISAGSSGGPILDTQGAVVGISVATIKGGQNLNFAIPVNFLSSLLSKTIPVGSEYYEPEVTPLSIYSTTHSKPISPLLSKEEKPQKGRLFVDLEPGYAEIEILDYFVNDYLKKAPRFYQGIVLEPGIHHLWVTAKGYKSKSVTFKSNPLQDTKIRIVLEAKDW